MTQPEIVLVAAVADNGVIGFDGGLPWHLPADLQHFKRTTMGHIMLMGRRTWESFNGPLPGRQSWVLTHDAAYSADGARVFHSLDEAVAACHEPELHVIGGAALFTLALPRASRLELTRVHANPAGDTHFPDIDMRDWEESWRQEAPADERNAHACTFLRLQRRWQD